MRDLGLFWPGQVVRFTFRTLSSAGALVDFSNAPTVSVRRLSDGSESTAGVTLTRNAGAVTGKHTIAVDLASNAFYQFGDSYEVFADNGDVGGISAATVFSSFCIGPKGIVGTISSPGARAITIPSGTALQPGYQVLVGTTAGGIEKRYVVSQAAQVVTLSGPDLALNYTGGRFVAVPDYISIGYGLSEAAAGRQETMLGESYNFVIDNTDQTSTETVLNIAPASGALPIDLKFSAIIMTSGALRGARRQISSYTATAGGRYLVTLASTEGLAAAPDNADTGLIV